MWRLSIAGVVVVSLVVLAPAEETPKKSLLTAKEIAEGWLLLFDGETTFGWKIDGDARVEKGALILGPKRATTALVTTAFNEFDLKAELSGQGTFSLRTQGAATRSSAYTGSGSLKNPWQMEVQSRKDEKVRPADDWKVVKMGAGMVQARHVHSGTNPVQISFHVGEGEELTINTIRLLPKGTGDLFNGKDLTGWKEFPGRKSKFSVTKEGWLNVKDGPGDLQTEGQYSNFVLQLECLSNGKHLNSGIFFRALPGQYQQGYEAQIRNQFTEKPDQKYVVEDYDPETHKLLGKRTVLSPAVDYGTGAIYRRTPARTAAAKDGEWFTMTVVAQGRHLATWVNGVQQVDWTDNRPSAENARNGYRAEKGVLSIQGHDPTTDLSFRNLRIAPLP
jgi:hypothetical protein